MTTPPPPSPSPLPGNPYAQAPDSQNPYAEQLPPRDNPYYSAPPKGVPPQGLPPVPPAPQSYGAPPAAPPQPYGQPPYGQPPQPYLQQPYGQPQQPYGQNPFSANANAATAAAQPGAVLTCRFCGGYPAVETTVRGHQGMIVLMRFRSVRGPFCRTCGTAVVREMSAKTLLQGWWGYASFLITPITLLRNLFVNRKIAALPAPFPGQPGQQLDPGAPLLRRPAALGFLIPIVALVVIIAAIAVSASGDSSPSSVSSGGLSAGSSDSDATNAKVGDCVRNNGTDDAPDLEIVTCTGGTMIVLSKLTGTTDDAGCPQQATADFTHSGVGDDFVLCLKDFTS